MGTQLSNHIRDGTRRTGCGDTQAWGHGSLAAEAFARFDPCTIHKFAIGDAVAALELNVFYAKDRRAAADYVLSNLEKYYFLFRQKGEEEIVRIWQERAAIKGKYMEINQMGESYKGICEGIDRDGAILLNIDGKTKKIIAGDVSF